MASPDIERLKASWTKYDAVKAINIIGNDEVKETLRTGEGIDAPVLKAYLGINDYTDKVPEYWQKVIEEYPRERRLFALLAGIFTHYWNIQAFAEDYATTNMEGVFRVDDNGKHGTNLRSALVEAGAASNSDRRKEEVPYSFAKIFEVENIGRYFKELLKDRLKKIGYSEKEVDEDFYHIAYKLHFHEALSLGEAQFHDWLEGKAIYQKNMPGFDVKEFKKLYQRINSIKVNQWLQEWDEVDFDQPMRKKPEDHFYIFSIDIRLLKRISDVHRRKARSPRASEVNVQRALKEDRSLEISNYVKYGFPLSTAKDKERSEDVNRPLRMPGILPSAILVNILGKDEQRGNSKIDDADLIIVKSKGANAEIIIPDTVFDDSDKGWSPQLKPIEIIDGQHRLWAFDETDGIEGKYEIPVVAYYDLDRAWQAYLFYMINIKPKKINTSLGYDLYPLLRTQEWLENSKEGLKVYRETRAQEMVEALWIYEVSPWHKRISMLGENSGNVSQNAFVRALTDSYFKKTNRGNGGIFADILKTKGEEIRWVRAQQAGFLILIWDEIARSLSDNDDERSVLAFEWIQKLREEPFKLTLNEEELSLDKSFVSKNSMLSRDQGVTGISMFSNDFFYIVADSEEYDFNQIEWDDEIDERQITSDSIDVAINKFRSHDLYKLIQLFAQEIIKMDWRTSSAPFNEARQSDFQKKYRGSGGYREIWNDLLALFLKSEVQEIVKYSSLLAQPK